MQVGHRLAHGRHLVAVHHRLGHLGEVPGHAHDGPARGAQLGVAVVGGGGRRAAAPGLQALDHAAHVRGVLVQDVALEEEHPKHHPHAAHIHYQENLDEVGGAAGGPLEVGQQALGEDRAELPQLQRRQVGRPPAAEAEGGEEVVRVHQHVHRAVQQDRQVHVPVELEGQDGAHDHVDAGVVEEVQEGHLPEGLAQQEEPRVHEFP
mmetsp:Transcript_32900/g.57217  ORF Transcript_32900/g.57217 Transcript_32900/m.57217 type:complete len:206 (+) Transcript_32900:474-1091(+)